MRVSTIRYTIAQGLRNIIKNKMFSIASIATMAACIFMFGIFYSLMTNVTYIVEKAEEGVAIVVFLDEDATEKDLKNIEKKLDIYTPYISFGFKYLPKTILLAASFNFAVLSTIQGLFPPNSNTTGIIFSEALLNTSLPTL